MNTAYDAALAWNPVLAWVLLFFAADHLVLEVLYWLTRLRSSVRRSGREIPDSDLPHLAIIV
ncbi:MAG: hypothetical protein AAB425_13830, partial [Bdellovibrionota bacterium]